MTRPSFTIATEFGTILVWNNPDGSQTAMITVKLN